MRLILDTCTFLWLAVDSPRLSARARALFVGPDNEVGLSAVSAWEPRSTPAIRRLYWVRRRTMATKVMVSFPEGLLAELDRVAGEEHRSRSELLREAFRTYVEARGRRRRPRELAEVRAAVAVQDELARSAPGRGEDSAEDVRRWREARS